MHALTLPGSIPCAHVFRHIAHAVHHVVQLLGHVARLGNDVGDLTKRGTSPPQEIRNRRALLAAVQDRCGKLDVLFNFLDIAQSLAFTLKACDLTRLELETLTPQIWKVRFRRANLKNTQDFYSELLFRVVTGTERNKKAVITSFQFL